MSWDDKAAAKAYERASVRNKEAGSRKAQHGNDQPRGTPESVERAAEVIWERNHGPAEKPVTLETLPEEIREPWRKDARTVIAALNQEKR